LKNFCIAPANIVSIAMEDGHAWAVTAQLEDGSIVFFNTARKLEREDLGMCSMEVVYRPPTAAVGTSTNSTTPETSVATSSQAYQDGLVFARGYLWATHNHCQLAVYNTSETSRHGTVVEHVGSHSFNESGCVVPDSVETQELTCNNFINCTSVLAATESAIASGDSDSVFLQRGSYACCHCLQKPDNSNGIQNHCKQTARGIAVTATPPFQQSGSGSSPKGMFSMIGSIMPRGPPPPVPNPFLTVAFRNHNSLGDISSKVVVYESAFIYHAPYSPTEWWSDISRVVVAIVIGIAIIFWRRMTKKDNKGGSNRWMRTVKAMTTTRKRKRDESEQREARRKEILVKSAREWMIAIIRVLLNPRQSRLYRLKS
jgi:hypothetical protein